MRLVVTVGDASLEQLLIPMLRNWGYSTVVARTEEEAVRELTRERGPHLGLIEGGSLGMSGLEVCRQVRAREELARAFLLFVTLSPTGPNATVALSAGADDFVNDYSELSEMAARLEAGARGLAWQRGLLRRLEQRPTFADLPEALTTVCFGCEKVRSPAGAWGTMTQILSHLGRKCTHGLCPTCYDVMIAEADQLVRAIVNRPAARRPAPRSAWN